ncbi:hypothetical protein DFH09DRAFT_1310986 [Mycena vulgaris]|nr:hypothetical protein DFH09DRAFT_1310986 [Mycena vulgaris]
MMRPNLNNLTLPTTRPDLSFLTPMPADNDTQPALAYHIHIPARSAMDLGLMTFSSPRDPGFTITGLEEAAIPPTPSRRSGLQCPSVPAALFPAKPRAFSPSSAGSGRPRFPWGTNEVSRHEESIPTPCWKTHAWRNARTPDRGASLKLHVAYERDEPGAGGEDGGCRSRASEDGCDGEPKQDPVAAPDGRSGGYRPIAGVDQVRDIDPEQGNADTPSFLALTSRI